MAPPPESPSTPDVPNVIAQKGRISRQVRSDSTNQSPLSSEQQGPFQDPNPGHSVSPTTEEVTTLGSPAQEMTSVMEELQFLRARMAQIMNGRDERVRMDRDSILMTLVPSDDDHQSAPPAYSEVGQR